VTRLPGRALLRRGRPVSLILLDYNAKLAEKEGNFHGDTVVSLVGPSVREGFLEHANVELRHADILAEGIQQLGGVPISAPAKIARTAAEAHVNVTQGAMVEAMVREDLEVERAQVNAYGEITLTSWS
jgi:Ferritin-like domain